MFYNDERSQTPRSYQFPEEKIMSKKTTSSETFLKAEGRSSSKALLKAEGHPSSKALLKAEGRSSRATPLELEGVQDSRGKKESA